MCKAVHKNYLELGVAVEAALIWNTATGVLIEISSLNEVFFTKKIFFLKKSWFSLDFSQNETKMTDFSQNDQKLAKQTSFKMFEVYSFWIHEVKTITYNFYIQNVTWFSFLEPLHIDIQTRIRWILVILWKIKWKIMIFEMFFSFKILRLKTWNCLDPCSSVSDQCCFNRYS